MPESIACCFYVAMVLIGTMVNLTIKGDLFLRLQQITLANSVSQDGPGGEVASSKMPVYLSIFAFAQ